MDYGIVLKQLEDCGRKIGAEMGMKEGDIIKVSVTAFVEEGSIRMSTTYVEPYGSDQNQTDTK